MQHHELMALQARREQFNALEMFVYAQQEPPTIAATASALKLPVDVVIRLATDHYWMFIAGDPALPETARIESDGE